MLSDAGRMPFPALLRMGESTRPEMRDLTPRPVFAASPASSARDTAADEPALVRAARAGDRRAFDQLVERHQRIVYAACYRFVGNQEDARDLTQDVFVRAYRAIARFKGKSAFSTWLHRIAVNTSLNHLAVRRREYEASEPERRVDESATAPDAGLVAAERAHLVRAAIARLPPMQRATLILRLYRELTHEEIAHILGNSVGASKANLFHALNNVRRQLEGRDLP
ncbi:MAG: sigma-70 family RNA polymerase sigma factor [Luteitalea sp.]|nr:sigma-70 family RNA polymerase sigma factor [Luteitalea sp.]